MAHDLQQLLDLLARNSGKPDAWILRKANAHNHPPAGLFADDIIIEPGRVNDDVRQSSQNILHATFLCPEAISKSTGLAMSIGLC